MYVAEMKEPHDISVLLGLERELKKPLSPWTRFWSDSIQQRALNVERDAKLNLLKDLQGRTVKEYEVAYDELYHELKANGDLELISKIVPDRSRALVQPKIFPELAQEHDDDARLAAQMKLYLAEAELAKPHLHALVKEVETELSGIEGLYPTDVKSIESTKRKAETFCGKDASKIADMARVGIVCDTAEVLLQAYRGIMTRVEPQNILRVTNGFISDWMPSGYRDVKINPVVNGHLCEIQLHIRYFFELKDGQHEVYEWARDLRVTVGISTGYIYDKESSEITQEMIRLARENWQGTKDALPVLLLNNGQPAAAKEALLQELATAQDTLRTLEGTTEERRRVALAVADAEQNLGFLHQSQAAYEDADVLYNKCLKTKQECLGRTHPEVAKTLQLKADLAKAQGHLDAAMRLYQSSYEMRQQLPFGPRHPDVAECLNNMAMLLRQQARYMEADEKYLSAQKILELTLGPGDFRVGLVFLNRSVLSQDQGDYAEADVLLSQAEEILPSVLGAKHPFTATAMSNRVVLLKAQERYSDALDYSIRAEEALVAALGDNHPNVATILNNRATLLMEQDQYDDAAVLLAKVVKIREDVLGADHPLFAEALGNGGRAHTKLGNFSAAERMFTRAELIMAASLGHNHPTYAMSLYNRGVLCFEQERLDEAETLFRRALEILESVAQGDQQIIDEINGYLALALMGQGIERMKMQDEGNLTEALQKLNEVLAISERTPGSHGLSIVTPLDAIACTSERLGKHDEALLHYERLQSVLESLPSISKSAVSAWFGRGRNTFLQGKHAESVPLFQRALQLAVEAGESFRSIENWLNKAYKKVEGATSSDDQSTESIGTEESKGV